MKQIAQRYVDRDRPFIPSEIDGPIWQASLGDYSQNSPGVTVSNNANMAVYSNAADITSQMLQTRKAK